MALIDPEGRLFGKVNIIDAVVVTAIVIAIFAYVLSRGSGKAEVAQAGNQPVEVDMLIRNLSIGDPKVFAIGKETQVVIRNQPAGSLTIGKVKVIPHLIPVVVNSRIENIPDPADPYGRDYLVTLLGTASTTDDGLIIGRVKAKIGTPIEIEGFKYVLKGGIVDVRLAPPKSAGAGSTP
ncbi:DUF4330 domain-containing protein [Gloeobacter kilaueensis]|uniref:DUF4330 domain-containing protein n=1 Tax=Gloeobacter kilaueensis (strain ATCC BAA-2537 / CCAP 1431/1 / ULC 316 / JS1) TaxID=1183438 RepID=U5QHM5_GLOK1|nr:DUF4330 domain-containing protein [Gloeobacter kilaueensis]AGY58363.1 hypothetical protein GKIL_2117 [Gloeobacter kilaueensis JS1]